MKITNLGIANFRSFDSEGILIENLSKLNIFIGKNNSGKSNILRFLNLCSKASEKGTEVTNPNNLLRTEFDKYENYFIGNKKNIEITISISPKYFLKNLIKYVRTDDLLTMKIDLFDGKVKEECEVFRNLNDQELYSFARDNKIRSSSRVGILETLNKLLVKKMMYYFSSLFSKIIFLPDFRKISEEEEDQKSNIVDGKNIISEMFKMQLPTYGQEENKKKFLKIKEFVRNLLDDQNINIEIPHNKENLLVEMNGYRRPLESFGTGIHELVIMCSALALYEKHTVCIEEPEIHLHPYLQRKFINFLLHQTNNTYFITTHSNVFLDFNENTSIYHVTYNKLKTEVSLANTSEKCCTILDDLGYKASDLLQANGIIWVEGPSDRIFLKRWIELLNNDFIEGIHYSIMFYGGKLLRHISMKASQFLTDEFIYLLRINKKAMIIIDRDGVSSDSQLNQTKKKD
jgi:predicted ATP-dependent endonuclease of OLD family